MGEITNLCREIYLENVEKEFWEHGPSENLDFLAATKLALIHAEVSEALEALRKGDEYDKHLPMYPAYSVELADIVIRVFDLAGWEGIPLGEVIQAKLAFNKTREPKHGKKF